MSFKDSSWNISVKFGNPNSLQRFFSYRANKQTNNAENPTPVAAGVGDYKLGQEHVLVTYIQRF